MTPEEVSRALRLRLPPATLLLGPLLEVRSISVKVLTHHKVHPADVAHISKLNADYSRDLVAFAGTAPYGFFKGVSICMEGATEQAQNILLKVLEEPPGSIRFILYGTCEPLPAIVSRCQVFYVAGHREQRAENAGSAQGKAAAAIRAARSGDPLLLAEALRSWDDESHDALREWALRGVAVQRGSDLPALKVLEVLVRYSRARPVNAAAAALFFAFLEE